MDPVLVDTGPLVALIRTNDINHERCKHQSQKITGPLLTTWPVLTEAAYLLRYDYRHVLALLRYVSEFELHVAELPPKAAEWFAEFFARYSDHEPQLADASLLYIADCRFAGRLHARSPRLLFLSLVRRSSIEHPRLAASFADPRKSCGIRRVPACALIR